MSAQHTPGPWHRNVAPATKYTTVWSGRNKHVARVVVDGLSPEEVEANICLIAAAPDLMAALAMARSILVELEDYRPDGPSVQVIDAAIAKATGGKA